MRTLRLLALVALAAGCHLDALFKGPVGGGGSPAGGALGARLMFTSQPNQATAGQAIAPVGIAVVDSAGQPLTGFTGAVTIALANPSGARLSGTQSVVAVSGVATFSDLTIDRAGQFTLRVSAAGAAAATSTPIEVIAPPPPPPTVTHLGFARQPLPSIQAGGVLSSVLVAALDASGNVVTTFNNAITVALGTNAAAGTLSGTLRVAAASGIATFSDLSIDNVGSGYTLQATTPGLPPAHSTSFDVTAAPPPPGGATYLRFTDQPQITQAGQVMPTVRVTAYDASDQKVFTFTGNVTITLGDNPATGTLTTASPTINMDLGLGGVVQWTERVYVACDVAGPAQRDQRPLRHHVRSPAAPERGYGPGLCPGTDDDARGRCLRAAGPRRRARVWWHDRPQLLGRDLDQPRREPGWGHAVRDATRIPREWIRDLLRLEDR